MFSRKSQYAIQALLCLAHNQDDGSSWVGVRCLASQTGIPEKWLSGIFLELRSAGIVESKRGKHGGYCLAASLDEVSLAQIFNVTEGRRSISFRSGCKNEEREDENWKFESLHEFMRPIMGKLRDAHARILDSTTLAQLLPDRHK